MKVLFWGLGALAAVRPSLGWIIENVWYEEEDKEDACKLALSTCEPTAPSECRSRCVANFSDFKSNRHGSDCTLLSVMPPVPQTGGLRDRPPTCTSHAVYGNRLEDLRGAATEVTSLSECQQQCYDEPSCVYWNVFNVATFNGTSGPASECVLKSKAMIEATRRPNDESQCTDHPFSEYRCGGVRVCVGTEPNTLGAPRVCEPGDVDVCSVLAEESSGGGEGSDSATPSTSTTTPATAARAAASRSFPVAAVGAASAGALAAVGAGAYGLARRRRRRTPTTDEVLFDGDEEEEEEDDLEAARERD